MSKGEEVITMTAKDFAEAMQSVMLSVITEARKPVLTEQDLRRIEAAQEAREEGAAREKERRANMIARRKACLHKRKDGTCAAVFVRGCGDPNLPDGTGSGNFFICQRCQAIVRPGRAPENYDGLDIFDNELFNRLWQEAAMADIIA